MALIFNEIIEINILGLSYNTKRNIVNRGEDEYLMKNKANRTISAISDCEGYSIELKTDIPNDWK